MRAALGQLPASGSGKRVLVRKPEEDKADNWHEHINWKNQSHVTGSEIVRDDHLINVRRLRPLKNTRGESMSQTGKASSR